MKKTLLLAVLILLAFSAKSQSPSQAGYTGVYKWNEAVQMQYCDKNGNQTSDNKAILSITGSKFTVYNVVKDSVVIKMYDYTVQQKYDWSKDSASRRILGNRPLFKVKDLFFLYNFNGTPKDYDTLSVVNANTRNYLKHQVYFKVPRNIFTQKSQKITRIASSFELGAINYPFKFRIGNGKTDFSGAFNLGAALGYKFAHDSLSTCTFSIPVAISITSVNIDSVSAMRNPSGLKTVNNFSALSFAIGGIFEKNKIQVGVFVGFDKISRLTNLQYGWVYQNKPWISIGFGYSLFSAEKPSTSGSDTAQQ